MPVPQALMTTVRADRKEWPEPRVRKKPRDGGERKSAREWGMGMARPDSSPASRSTVRPLLYTSRSTLEDELRSGDGDREAQQRGTERETEGRTAAPETQS